MHKAPNIRLYYVALEKTISKVLTHNLITKQQLLMNRIIS